MKIIELGRNESVVLAHGAILTVCKIKPGMVSLGVTAPASVSIERPERKKGPKAGERKPPREFARDPVR